MSLDEGSHADFTATTSGVATAAAAGSGAGNTRRPAIAAEFRCPG